MTFMVSLLFTMLPSALFRIRPCSVARPPPPVHFPARLGLRHDLAFVLAGTHGLAWRAGPSGRSREARADGKTRRVSLTLTASGRSVVVHEDGGAGLGPKGRCRPKRDSLIC